LGEQRGSDTLVVLFLHQTMGFQLNIIKILIDFILYLNPQPLNED